MDITFKNIVEILNIDAPIFYIDMENIKGSNNISFRYIGDEEVKDILNGKHDINKQYDNSEIGIYFSNLNIYDCYELEMKRNPVACNVYIENISFKMKVLMDEIPLVWAIYCVLHEYGHYLHFKVSELMPFKYREERIEEQSKYSELVNAIRDISDLDPCKKYIAEQYQKNVYMKYSDEKYANEYAMDHIVEAYNKVKQNI